MSSVKNHYEYLLAEHYTWMFGDYDANVRENMRFFERNGVTPRLGGKALDLGCGSGFQSMALAELGFRVLAIDLCDTLLAELRNRRGERHIESIQGDMLDGRIYAHKAPFEVAVCMGDTVTHLEANEHVLTIIHNVYRNLERRGKFVLTFRDLTTELKGTDRIKLVRGDDAKLMATFLEYREHHVNVHDAIFVRTDSGWDLEKGVYKKLRIGSDQIRDLLRHVGFRISSRQRENGFSTIVAQK